MIGRLLLGLLIVALAPLWLFAADETKPAASPAVAPAKVDPHKAGDLRDDNGLKIKLVYCPPGEFLMGASEEERKKVYAKYANRTLAEEEAQVKVKLTKGFWIGRYTVTQAEWLKVMDSEPWKSTESHDDPKLPVTSISWTDARTFCQKLTKQEHKSGRLLGERFELPTLAQWEYAYRAGTTTTYFFGDDPDALGDYAWCDRNAIDADAIARSSASAIRNRVDLNRHYPHPVGEKKPNAWGLYDMCGNVAQLCLDADSGSSRQKARVGGDDPFNSDGKTFWWRGGSWWAPDERCRAASLGSGSSAWYTERSVGFRLVLKAADDEVGLKMPLTSEPAPPVRFRPSRVKEPVRPKSGDVRDDNELKMKLVLCIPKGTFVIGSPESEIGPSGKHEDAENQSSVTIHTDFWIGKYVVTQAEWRKLMDSEPWKANPNAKAGDQYPAANVNWDDARKFCEKLTERERKADRLPTGYKFELPTEVQWELACRAETTSAYFFGDDQKVLDEYAWFEKNAKDAGEKYGHEVGQKKPNPWGIYDMYGNVSQWCLDGYTDQLPYGMGIPYHDEGSDRVIRGGTWSQPAANCRSASRDKHRAVKADFDLGFRVALVKLPYRG